MKKDTITFEDIKSHLTEEQREKYFLPEFKKEIDRRIREANRTPGTISPTILNHRSGVLQKYYSIIQSLDFDEFEKFKALLEALGKPGLTDAQEIKIAREYLVFESTQLLVVLKDYHGTILGCYIPHEDILREFANSCKSYLYVDLL